GPTTVARKQLVRQQNRNICKFIFTIPSLIPSCSFLSLATANCCLLLKNYAANISANAGPVIYNEATTMCAFNQIMNYQPLVVQPAAFLQPAAPAETLQLNPSALAMANIMAQHDLWQNILQHQQQHQLHASLIPNHFYPSHRVVRCKRLPFLLSTQHLRLGIHNTFSVSLHLLVPFQLPLLNCIRDSKPSSSPRHTSSSTNHCRGRMTCGPEACNLFIFHLPQVCDATYLVILFSRFRRVISAKVYANPAAQQSKCSGYFRPI
uniref:Uncharacterized protein n=1 Tax=Echinococcus canadensis TaxID=519352 RepID=A0A915EWB9_9CEST